MNILGAITLFIAASIYQLTSKTDNAKLHSVHIVFGRL